MGIVGIKIFDNFHKIIKSKSIISFPVLIPVSSFYPILYLISMTPSIKNVFNFLFFLLLIITGGASSFTWHFRLKISQILIIVTWEQNGFNLTNTILAIDVCQNV